MLSPPLIFFVFVTEALTLRTSFAQSPIDNSQQGTSDIDSKLDTVQHIKSRRLRKRLKNRRDEKLFPRDSPDRVPVPEEPTFYPDVSIFPYDEDQTNDIDIGIKDLVGEIIDKENVRDYVPLFCNESLVDPVQRALGGLWWLQGIPQPEVLAAQGVGTWSDGEKSCSLSTNSFYNPSERKSGMIQDDSEFLPGGAIPCRGRYVLSTYKIALEQPVYANWVMPGDADGIGYARFGAFTDNGLDYVCGGPKGTDEITYCKLGITQDWYGTPENIPEDQFYEFVNKKLELRMKKVSEHVWHRTSSDLKTGMRWDYYPKRLITCDGEVIEENWQEFLGKRKSSITSMKNVFGPVVAPNRLLVIKEKNNDKN